MATFPLDPLTTSALSAAGLLGGFAVARQTKNRPLGGVVLAAAGAACTASWTRSSGGKTAGILLATYLGAFGGSHVLAKKIGAWPSVAAVAAITAGASLALTQN